MSVALYDGAWGLQRNGKIEGPWLATGSDDLSRAFSLNGGVEPAKQTRYDSGAYLFFHDDPSDIIAVFPTPEEAEAHVASKKPEPAADGASIPPADPKPMTWPVGLTEMELEDGTTVRLTDGSLLFLGFEFTPEQARQLADLLRAAADYVDGGGK